MVKRILWILLCVLVGMASATSQWNVVAGVTSMSDDNVSNSYYRGSDRVTIFSANPSYEYIVDSTTTQVWYDAAFAFYGTFTDRSFQYHSFGVNHSRVFGSEDAGTAEFSADYVVRKNRDSFVLFDHTTWGFGAAAEYYFTEYIAAAARYQFHSMTFAQLGEFDYREHIVSAKQSLQASPTTTIILHNEIALKNYSQSASTDSTLLAQSGLMSGKVQRTVQLISSLRIGQSLGTNTGVSFSAGYRYNFQQSARYLTSNYGTLSEDELINDHYGYEGPRVGFLFTQLLPASTTVRLRFDQEQRNYPLLGAYDIAGYQTDAQRNDSYRVFSAVMEKKWDNIPLFVMLSFEYIRNVSNDAYYDYANNVFSVGITIPI